jgi:hypothetical protein
MPVSSRRSRENNPFADIFPEGVEVSLPPLIGGFVGSDALACLLYMGLTGRPRRWLPSTWGPTASDGHRWPAHPWRRPRQVRRSKA